MNVKVSLMGDLCFPWPVCLTAHDGMPCFEMPTPMMWFAGFALGQNQLSKTVRHANQFITLGGHDCGHMIPHIGPPILAPQLPLIIMFSSRKVMFASSTVKANGTPIACTEAFGAHPPLPMMCCGSPVSYPAGFPAFNSFHTLSVGLTVADLVAGFVAIAVAMVGRWVCRLGPLRKGLEGFPRELVGAATCKQFFVKQILGIASGAAKIAFTGEGRLQVEVGSAYAGAGVSSAHTRDGRRESGEGHFMAWQVNVDKSNRWSAGYRWGTSL